MYRDRFLILFCFCTGLLMFAAGSISRAETNAVGVVSTNAVQTVKGDPRDEAYEKITILTEALLMVRRHYVEEKSYEQIVYGALHGMMENLDPHSAFLEPDQYRKMNEATSGRFGGIGIRVGVRDRILTVIAPIEGSPAFLAGILAGDRIMKIDGMRAVGMSLQHALRLMRGEKGEKVTLTIQRKGEDELFDLSIARDDIIVPSVKGVQMLNADTGYIRITQFNRPADAAFEKALLDLQARGMTSLILDLRNNPGGLLKGAVKVAERLLPEGALIVTTRGRGGKDTDVPREAEGGIHLTSPDLVVLINGGSASASEVVTGALQDHHRAVVVGERSFGKASVQNIVRMRSNPDSAIRITTAHYYTPKGRMIHGSGIDPDIVVEVSAEEWRDVQLQRAYREDPELYPKEKRKLFVDLHDRALERALDILTAMRVLKLREKD